MAILQCRNGHYYDGEKYEECPYCGCEALSQGSEELITLPIEYIREEEDEGKTIGLFSEIKGNVKVTGWLVCIEGYTVGQDYRLRHGWNRIGRDLDMEVSIFEEPELAEAMNAAVVYEPKANLFYLVSGPGAGVYLNEKRLTGSAELTAGDIIQIGSTKLLFIPFCEGDRKWKE